MARLKYFLDLPIVKRSLSISIILLLVLSVFVINVPAPIRAVQTFVGPTYVSGSIDTPQTWSLGNSPYILNGNVTIGPNGVLTIEPGVLIKVHYNGWIKVTGRMYSNGTEANPILFYPYGSNITGYWDGLFIESDGNTLLNTNVSYCNTSAYLRGTDTDPVDSNLIDRCLFDNVAHTGIVMLNGTNNDIFNNTIVNSGNGLMKIHNSSNNYFASNYFSDSDPYGIEMLSSNYNYFTNNTYRNVFSGAMFFAKNFFVGYDIFYMGNSCHNTFLYDYMWRGTENSEYGLKLYDGSNYNSFYNMEIFDHFSYQVAIQNSHNNTFVDCDITSAASSGVSVDNSTDITFINTSIGSGTSSTSIGLFNSATVYVVNTTYDNSTQLFMDQESKLIIQFFLNVTVKESGTLNPISGALVDIKDYYKTPVGSYPTQQDGKTGGIILTHNIWNFSQKIFYTPHNVTVTKALYETNYADPEPDMTQSRSIEVILTPLTIDYIQIQDAPGEGSPTPNTEHIGVGETRNFYAVGYNDTYGYMSGVSANWGSNNTAGTVTTPGTQTTLTTSNTNHGMVRITADFSSLTDYVDIYVDPVQIDYVLIQDTNDANGRWIGKKQYPLGGSDTFYCGGYNTTVGFVRLLSASWTSDDISIGTVTPTGSQTSFSASNSTWGTTRVEVLTGGKMNRTGALVVTGPTIDRIEIEEETGGWVGPRSYNKDDTERYVCIGYNGSVGKVGEVTPSWRSLDTSVGTVTTGGNLTTFTAVDGGTTQVEATYSGLTNRTGTLTVIVISAPDFDLTAQISVKPAGPVLEGSNFTITATIENLGTDPVENIDVYFYIHDLSKSGDELTSEDNITVLNGGKSINLEYVSPPFKEGNYDFIIVVDPNNAHEEILEDNNRVNYTVAVLNREDFTISIEIKPMNITITADETVQFNAVGKGYDGSNYPIDPTWSVSGGGDIDSNGFFIARIAGIWNVYADFGIQGSAIITITPGKLKSIKITEKIDIMKIGDTFKFGLSGFDSDGNTFDKPIIGVTWYVNGSIGVIDNKGMFNATAEGAGHIGANVTIDLQDLKDEVDVFVKRVIIIERKYDIPTDNENISFRIEFAFNGEGNATVKHLGERNLSDEQIPDDSFGDRFKHINIFVKIEIPGDAKFEWLIIECKYDPALLPANVSEKDLKLFYFSKSQNKWVLCENTWVDTVNHIVYANVTHLTIFAPMAESGGGGGGGGGDDDGGDGGGGGDKAAGINMMVILALIAVVFIIAMAAGVIIVRKRRPTGEETEMAGEEEETEKDLVEREMVEKDLEDEDIEIDLSELKMITKKCPRCKTAIDVEPTFDEKVHLQCPECDKEGRLPNPYLKEIEHLRETKRKETMREKKRDYTPIEFDCPKCETTNEVPYSKTDPKVKIKCKECGARGSIKNPYLDAEKEPKKKDKDRDKPKPPKDRKPPAKDEKKDKKKKSEVKKKEEKHIEDEKEEEEDEDLDFDFSKVKSDKDKEQIKKDEEEEDDLDFDMT